MASDEGFNRGFCAAGKQLNGRDDITLTSYVWEYLGNAIPSDIYNLDTNYYMKIKRGCHIINGYVR